MDPKAQISSNSAWSDSSRIGEGSIVARSSVGRHCVVGKNVKIINSIIMEHVELGDWYAQFMRETELLISAKGSKSKTVS